MTEGEKVRVMSTIKTCKDMECPEVVDTGQGQANLGYQLLANAVVCHCLLIQKVAACRDNLDQLGMQTVP